MHAFEVISALMWAGGAVLLLVPNLLLSLKLRKERKRITEEIVKNVPDHMRTRVRFTIDSNMSWVFGSTSLYLWFSWLMYKFGWHVTNAQLKGWHSAIKRAYGRHIYLAYVSCFGANLASVGFIIFLCLFGTSEKQ